MELLQVNATKCYIFLQWSIFMFKYEKGMLPASFWGKKKKPKRLNLTGNIPEFPVKIAIRHIIVVSISFARSDEGHHKISSHCLGWRGETQQKPHAKSPISFLFPKPLKNWLLQLHLANICMSGSASAAPKVSKWLVGGWRQLAQVSREMGAHTSPPGWSCRLYLLPRLHSGSAWAFFALTCNTEKLA